MKSVQDLALGQLNILARVAQRDLVLIGEARRNRNKIQTPERAHRGVKSRGLLGMLRPVKCSLQIGSAARPVIPPDFSRARQVDPCR